MIARSSCKPADGPGWFVIALATLSLTIGLSAPAAAHKDKAHGPAEASQTANAPDQMANRMSVGEHGNMPGMSEDMASHMQPANLSFTDRILGWIGRIHPLLVHFPIAFFPAALFTAIAGRRRPAFAAPVQFLVVAGGIFAPVAAGAGWLAGMSADPEAILTYHRWLGIAIGISGAGLGWWAWKRPWEDRGAGMILSLTLITIAVAIQGFLGAGLTHGIQHLMF